LNAVEIQDVRGDFYDFNCSFEIQSPSFLKTLDLKWDFDQPCRHCGYIIYFMGDPVALRKNVALVERLFCKIANFSDYARPELTIWERIAFRIITSSLLDQPDLKMKLAKVDLNQFMETIPFCYRTHVSSLTCNPYWPEIKSMLIEGQTAYDRADVTCEVFHARVEIFMNHLRLVKHFVPHYKIVHEILSVIEYRQCGLPHVHIVVQLSNIPHYNTERSRLTSWIDRNINATSPQISDSSSDGMKNIHHLTKTHMVHKCKG